MRMTSMSSGRLAAAAAAASRLAFASAISGVSLNPSMYAASSAWPCSRASAAV